MRIKTLKPVLLAGHSNTKPVLVGTVVDSDGDKQKELEYKALINAGYAKQTNEAVGAPKVKSLSKMSGTPARTVRRGANPDAPFDPAAEHVDDAFFNEVLAGTNDDVEANLSGLDDNALARMAYLEGQRADGGRKGALGHIEAARAALVPAGDEG